MDLVGKACLPVVSAKLSITNTVRLDIYLHIKAVIGNPVGENRFHKQAK